VGVGGEFRGDAMTRAEWLILFVLVGDALAIAFVVGVGR
jgi:hypothetical protein